MIFSLILIPLTFIINILFSVLPIIAFPQPVYDALNYATTSLYTLNSFIPLDTFGTVLKAYLTIELAILAFKFINYLVGKIPFANMK